MLAPHESSQAHREHIRTSGFYLPFLFFFSAPARSRLGVESVRCHTPGPKELHVVGFHILRSPLERYGKWPFLLPASAASFTLECSLTRAAEAERTALRVEPKNPRLARGYVRAGASRRWNQAETLSFFNVDLKTDDQ